MLNIYYKADVYSASSAAQNHNRQLI